MWASVSVFVSYKLLIKSYTYLKYLEYISEIVFFLIYVIPDRSYSSEESKTWLGTFLSTVEESISQLHRPQLVVPVVYH